MVNQIDLKDVADSFSQAAKSYDEAALFQRIAGDRLLERLNYFKLKPETILDIGSGTGHCTRALKANYPDAKVIGLDIAQGMVDYSQALSKTEDYLCADAMNIPLESDSQDLVFSNLTFQWIEEIDALFKEIHRVLKPNGLLLFTSLGPDTLFELKQSWQKIDQYKHVNDFIDMHHLGSAMQNAYLLEPAVANETVVMNYDKAIELMRDLKDIGAHNIDQKRHKGLTGSGRIKQLEKEYAKFALESGQLPATYELIYGHAFGIKVLPRF